MTKNNKIKIVVHNGSFHVDDIFACATLSILLKDNFDIVRSRDPEVISTGDYVVDVGEIYDEAKNHFDHHQTAGAGKRENGIPYASFGLVWKKFGGQVCDSEEVALYVDKKLVEPIDASDNGVETFKNIFPDLIPYMIQSLVEAFIPSWKEEQKNLDSKFLKLVNLAIDVLNNEIQKAKDNIEGEKFVRDIYEKTTDKRLIILDKGYPWENVLNRYPEPLFVVLPKDAINKWQVKTIEDRAVRFKNRKDLPKEWGGLANKELEEVTGVKGSLFCHRNLFLAVAENKEATIKLAELALKN